MICGHKEAVIWNFQLHQGLVFRMGTVAVNAFFQLAQRTVRRCIDHLLRTFDMPAAIAQGRPETQIGKNGGGGQ